MITAASTAPTLPRTPSNCGSRPTVQPHPAAGATTDPAAANGGSFPGLKDIRIDKGKIPGRFCNSRNGMENGISFSGAGLRVSGCCPCETVRHFLGRRGCLFGAGLRWWSKLTEVSEMEKRDEIEAALSIGALVMILAWTLIAWLVLVP